MAPGIVIARFNYLDAFQPETTTLGTVATAHLTDTFL